MDHDVVVRQQMTERYLLNELNPEARDEFEEHYFGCPDCAIDVRAGVLFVEQSKKLLTPRADYNPEPGVPSRPPKLVPPRSEWFQWLRPAFAVPLVALLLVVIGYQNLVTYPRLEQAVNHPQVLPWTQINVGTMGANSPVITARAGEGFLLFTRIPPDGSYSSYVADLYNPAGKLEWSVKIVANVGQDQYPVQVQASNHEPGNYRLMVHGITAAGESKDVGQASFELQIQK